MKTTKIFVLSIIALLSCGLMGMAGCASGSGGGKETIVYQEDFENGAGNWLSRYGETVGVVEGIAQSGTYALKISKRDNTGSGAIHDFSGILLPNQTYRISAWLMFDDDSAESQTIVLTADQETEGQGHTYTNIAGERLPKGDWTYLETEYTVPRSQYELSLKLYFEGTYHADQTQAKPSEFFDFYVDNVTVTKLPPAPPPKVETDIPSLYEALDLGIPLGGTIDYAYLNQSNIYNGMLRHFNAFVYGNEMKPDATEPSEGRFQLEKMNALMDYTERVGAKMRGHVLVWHQQTPQWVTQGSGPNGLATKNELYARLKNHIQTLVRNGKGRVYAWDVCNEVVGDDGEPRDSRYHQIMVNEGLPDYDYVLQAFKWAYEADPDAILCINDYSVESSSAKQDGYYNLVQWLIEQGAPVSGVGLQAHINMSWPTVADMRNCIERFAALTTVDGKKMKVQVTEFDMSIYANSGEAKKKADREILLDQAFQYKALFDMFRQEAKLGNLDLVLVWGIADKDTWLDNSPVAGRTDYPLFFGKDLRAKPAYWVMVDPSHMPIQLKKIDATRADHELADINDRAWQLVSPRNIVDTKGNNYGWFKVMWTSSNLYVQARINDATKDAADGVTVFIEPKNQKADPKSEAAFSKDFARSTAVADDGTGYTLLSAIPIEAKLDAKIGFDLRVKDGGAAHSWNDFDDSQDKVSINYGTVNLRALPPVTYAKRGTIDMEGRRIDMDAWEKIAPVPMTVKSDGFTQEGSQFRVMWDDRYVYTLVEVVDPVLNDRSTTVHEQDTIEIFLDQNNGKTTKYEADDGQYRVSFRNFQSFNGGDPSLFKSRTLARAGGYVVETAVPIYSVKPQVGTLFGYDVQINDAGASGTREGIRNWADGSNMGYQDTSGFGILVLTD